MVESSSNDSKWSLVVQTPSNQKQYFITRALGNCNNLVAYGLVISTKQLIAFDKMKGVLWQSIEIPL